MTGLFLALLWSLPSCAEESGFPSPEAAFVPLLSPIQEIAESAKKIGKKFPSLSDSHTLLHRVALDEKVYNRIWHSDITFLAQGRKVHVSGSRSWDAKKQESGDVFIIFFAEGEPIQDKKNPAFVNLDKTISSPQQKEILDVPFTIRIHPTTGEVLKGTIRKIIGSGPEPDLNKVELLVEPSLPEAENSTSLRCGEKNCTVHDIFKQIQNISPTLTLSKEGASRDFVLFYANDLNQDSQGEGSLGDTRALLMMPIEEKIDPKSAVRINDKIFFLPGRPWPEDSRMVSRKLGKFKNSHNEEVEFEFGFHVTPEQVLQIYDLSEKPPSNL